MTKTLLVAALLSATTFCAMAQTPAVATTTKSAPAAESPVTKASTAPATKKHAKKHHKAAKAAPVAPAAAK